MISYLSADLRVALSALQEVEKDGKSLGFFPLNADPFHFQKKLINRFASLKALRGRTRQELVDIALAAIAALREAATITKTTNMFDELSSPFAKEIRRLSLDIALIETED